MNGSMGCVERCFGWWLWDASDSIEAARCPGGSRRPENNPLFALTSKGHLQQGGGDAAVADVMAGADGTAVKEGLGGGVGQGVRGHEGQVEANGKHTSALGGRRGLGMWHEGCEA